MTDNYSRDDFLRGRAAGDVIAYTVDDGAIVKALAFPLNGGGVEVDPIALDAKRPSCLLGDEEGAARNDVAKSAQRVSLGAEAIAILQVHLGVAGEALKP